MFFATSIALVSGFNYPAIETNADYCSSDDGIKALDWDTTCTRYFQCEGGIWTVKSCQIGMVVDQATNQCTNPGKVVEWLRADCKENAEKVQEDQLKEKKFDTSPEVSNTDIDSKNPYLCVGHDPHIPIAHRDCNKYRQCVNGFWHTRECGPETVFDVSKLSCAHKDQAWGCGLEAESDYKKQVEKWIAFAKEEEAKKKQIVAERPEQQPTNFANFGGINEDGGIAYEYPVGQPGELFGDLDVALTEPSEFAPREGSPCHGPGLFPVEFKCGIYLQCAPDSLLMTRHCPAQTFFEPATSKCDYRERLQRTDCNLSEDGSADDDLSGLPSATLLQKLIELSRTS